MLIRIDMILPQTEDKFYKELHALPSQEQRPAFMKYAQRHPVEWIEDVLGGKLWSMQKTVAEALLVHDRVYVASCNAAGKDWLAGRLVLWFLYSFPKSKVITTASTDFQVKTVMWSSNIKTAWNAASKNLQKILSGTIDQEPMIKEFKIDSDWYAIGFKSADYHPERFSGHHAPYKLIVISEASDFQDPEMWEAIEGLMASGMSKLLVVGNPLDTACQFAQPFLVPTGFIKCFNFSAWEAPNAQTAKWGREGKVMTLQDFRRGQDTDELLEPGYNKPEYADICKWDFAWSLLQRFGAKNAQYIKRAKGQFTEEDEDRIISLADINYAKGLAVEPGEGDLRVLSIDPSSGSGPDDTGFCYRHGGKVLRIWRSHDDPVTTAGKVRLAITEGVGGMELLDEIRVDMDGGYGDGVTGRLEEFKTQDDFPEGIKLLAVRSAGPPWRQGDRYADRRSEEWGVAAKMLGDGEIDLSVLEGMEPELRMEFIRQVTAPKRDVVGGRIKIEKKEKTKERIGKSPDLADAFVYAFAPMQKGINDLQWV